MLLVKFDNMYVKKLLFSSLLILLICTDFSLSSSTSIGKYNAGCIKNSAELPETGLGYQIIRPNRKRNHGNNTMIEYIKKFTKEFNFKHKANVLIADISKKGGGPILDDHSSHQTGLDADILLLHKNSVNELYTISERESLKPISKLNGSKSSIDFNKWSPLNGELLKTAASYDEVDRIFINPAIKKHLCKTYNNEPWLKKLRPWWGHDGHFHVRLSCPSGNQKCVDLESPKDIECGAGLDWWFSKDAYEKLKNRRSKPITEKDIILPKECLNQK